MDSHYRNSTGVNRIGPRPYRSLFQFGHIDNFGVELQETTPEEPETTIADMVPGHCEMPSCERWHCILTTKEKETSAGIHLLDWQPYRKSWGDEQLSTRHADSSSGKGTSIGRMGRNQIRQVATLPPRHSAGLRADEAQKERVWNYNHICLLYLEESGEGGDDRSRTHFEKVRVTQKARAMAKVRVLARKERSLLRLLALSKEKKRKELVENSFQALPHFLKHGKKRNLTKLLCQVRLVRNLITRPWCSSRVRMESLSLGEHGSFLMPLQE